MRRNSAPLAASRGTTEARAPRLSQTDSSNIYCFNYGEMGHKRNECRKLASRSGKQLLNEEGNLVEEEAAPMYDEDGAPKEEALIGDRGEVLVVKKSFLAPKQ